MACYNFFKTRSTIFYRLYFKLSMNFDAACHAELVSASIINLYQRLAQSIIEEFYWMDPETSSG